MSDKSDRKLYHAYETLNMSKMSGGGHSPPLSRATSPLNHDYESGKNQLMRSPVSEFNAFEKRLKSAKNRFQLSSGLNLESETLNTIFYLSRGLDLNF